MVKVIHLEERGIMRHLALRVGGAALAVLTVLSVTGPAQARPTSPESAVTGYCAVLVSKQPVGPGGSTEVSRACSETRASAAAAAGATADTLLLSIYADSNYGGYQYHFYGDDGHCDATGYRINLGWAIRNIASSMKGYNYCNSARAYDGVDLTGTSWWYGQSGRYLYVPWVGAGANDRFDSLQVKYW